MCSAWRYTIITLFTAEGVYHCSDNILYQEINVTNLDSSVIGPARKREATMYDVATIIEAEASSACPYEAPVSLFSKQ